jgi:hypothetical protein
MRRLNHTRFSRVWRVVAYVWPGFLNEFLTIGAVAVTFVTLDATFGTAEQTNVAFATKKSVKS